MGIYDTVDDSEEEESDSKPSVSYIYVYEKGRDEIENMSNYLTDAYEVTSNGGIVRDYFSDGSEYKNIHEGFSHFLVGMAEALEEGDFTRILDFLLEPSDPDNDEEVEFFTNAVAQWLDTQPEIRQELIRRLKETQEGKAAVEGDD